MTKREQLTKTKEWIVGAQYYRVLKSTSDVIGFGLVCVSVDPKTDSVVLVNKKTGEHRGLNKHEWHSRYRLASLPPGHGLTPGEQMAFPTVWMDRWVKNNVLCVVRESSV